jgi:hypothetical protein
MRSLALRLGILSFVTLLGWTSANAATCTGLKLVCPHGRDTRIATAGWPYCEKLCNFRWDQCMKSGWWAGRLSRAVERR